MCTAAASVPAISLRSYHCGCVCLELRVHCVCDILCVVDAAAAVSAWSASCAQGQGDCYAHVIRPVETSFLVRPTFRCCQRVGLRRSHWAVNARGRHAPGFCVLTGWWRCVQADNFFVIMKCVISPALQPGSHTRSW